MACHNQKIWECPRLICNVNWKNIQKRFRREGPIRRFMEVRVGVREEDAGETEIEQDESRLQKNQGKAERGGR